MTDQPRRVYVRAQWGREHLQVSVRVPGEEALGGEGPASGMMYDGRGDSNGQNPENAGPGDLVGRVEQATLVSRSKSARPTGPVSTSNLIAFPGYHLFFRD